MTNEQPQQEPDWEQVKKAMEDAFAKFGKAMTQTGKVLAAQGAMGWAYRGDLEQLRTALARMTPDQLAEMSAAAALLASACDEELRQADP